MAQTSPDNAPRFAFGANWRDYAATLDESAIERAEASLRRLLDGADLTGRSFLDIGSGSGLFSLASRRLGARVLSFDYDSTSVAVTAGLRDRFFPGDKDWRIEQGSALDAGYLAKLGPFDIVYSWGVLHHTGDMWTALANVVQAVAPGGILAIAIYNDQGRTSWIWGRVKHAYNRLPRRLRFLVLWPAFLRLWGPSLIRDFLTGKGLSRWCEYQSERGMSPWHDVVDWVGGWPFEVATPEAITAFYRQRGFRLIRETTVGRGHGCNEFVFRRA